MVWSRLGAEDAIPEGGAPGDGVTEVLAHRSDNLRDKFIEIPCSEDYDSHKRFEGNWTGLSEADGGAQRAGTAWLLPGPGNQTWAAKLPCLQQTPGRCLLTKAPNARAPRASPEVDSELILFPSFLHNSLLKLLWLDSVK